MDCKCHWNVFEHNAVVALKTTNDSKSGNVLRQISPNERYASVEKEGNLEQELEYMTNKHRKMLIEYVTIQQHNRS